MGKLAALFAVLLASVGPALAEAERSTIPRDDGSEIQFQLDRPAEAGPVPLLVLAQGSGCLPALQSRALATIGAAFADMAILTVEKYGVLPDDRPADDTMDCSATYHAENTMSQRVRDYTQVIDNLRGQTWWNGKLVLFGGSEGGLVMGTLAGQVTADLAVLLSTAPGGTFAEIVISAVPPEGHATVEAGFENARNNPGSTELWAGYSLRFWADALDHRVADDMLTADTGFLVIQGGQDPVPVALARAVSDMFAADAQCNLTYWELPSLDHGMSDPAGTSHLQAVATDVAAWVNRQLAMPAC